MIALLVALTAVSLAAVPMVLLVRGDDDARVVSAVGTLCGLTVGALGWAGVAG